MPDPATGHHMLGMAGIPPEVCGELRSGRAGRLPTLVA